MAAGSLLLLLDDIATVLDDVAAMSKIAARKTAGVLGDDLALNAQQVTGVRAERELPVVWAVTKGSLRNKAILVPAALLISAVAPWLVTPLLMLGGAYLCFEGAEKLAHRWLHAAEEDAHHAEHLAALADPARDVVAVEKRKIAGAVRTDFILSAEIIAITLGAVSAAGVDFLTRVLVLIAIALIMTVGVYGLVAGIVKLDDIGLWLSNKPDALRRGLGRGLLAFAPWLMKTLSVVGTAAMFTVGGGILVHGIPALHHGVEQLTHGFGGITGGLVSALLQAGFGIVAGALLVVVVEGGTRLWKRK